MSSEGRTIPAARRPELRGRLRPIDPGHYGVSQRAGQRHRPWGPMLLRRDHWPWGPKIGAAILLIVIALA